MTKIWKRKEWLLSEGHIAEITRGRISLDNQERCEEAARNGVKFSDLTVKSVAGVETVTKATYQTEKHIPDIPDARYPVETTRVYTMDGALTKANTRAACFNCSVSLAYCTCDAPRAIVSNSSGYVPVRLEIQ